MACQTTFVSGQTFDAMMVLYILKLPLLVELNLKASIYILPKTIYPLTDHISLKNNIAILKLKTPIYWAKLGVAPVCPPTTCRERTYTNSKIINEPTQGIL